MAPRSEKKNTKKSTLQVRKAREVRKRSNLGPAIGKRNLAFPNVDHAEQPLTLTPPTEGPTVAMKEYKAFSAKEAAQRAKR